MERKNQRQNYRLVLSLVLLYFTHPILAFSTTMIDSSSSSSSNSGADVIIQAVTFDHPEMHKCFSVRRRVFIEEQQVPEDIEMDANDKTATHILATTMDGTAVGAARIVLVVDDEAENSDGDGGTNKKIGKIGRVCALPEHRRKGFGRKIVLFAVDELRRTIGTGGIAKLGSQVHAIEFYKSMSFELIPGDEYMDAGNVPHRDMQLIL